MVQSFDSLVWNHDLPPNNWGPKRVASLCVSVLSSSLHDVRKPLREFVPCGNETKEKGKKK